MQWEENSKKNLLKLVNELSPVPFDIDQAMDKYKQELEGANEVFYLFLFKQKIT